MALFTRFILLCVLCFGTLLSHSHAGTTTSILLFGDSITAGYGLAAEASLPMQLQTRLQARGFEVNVINAGVSGDTTGGGRSRLEWTLNKFNPKVVIIGLGGNDALRGIPPELTRANLDAMLSIVKARQDIRVIVSAVTAPSNLGEEYAQSFNAIYPELVKHHGAALYPFYLEKIYGKPEYMQADGIHPNAAGVEMIADELSDYLAHGALAP